MALRHEKRLLQKSEINLGREGTAQAANFPELRNEIVALKKLEQEQKEVTLRIARIEEGIKKIEQERQQNAREQSETIAKLEAEKKPLLQRRNQTKNNVDVCERELAAQGVAPPNAPNLLTEAHRRREAVDRHLAHKAELASLSSQIDKQELRKFYFSIFSVLVLLAITLLVIFQSPRGREWLPQETD